MIESMPDMSYEHEELVKAVNRLESLGDFSNRVDASRKAGDLLNQALDSFEKKMVKGLAELERSELERENLEGNLGSFS